MIKFIFAGLVGGGLLWTGFTAQGVFAGLVAIFFAYALMGLFEAVTGVEMGEIGEEWECLSERAQALVVLTAIAAVFGLLSLLIQTS